MANKLRNEIDIVLCGRDFTLRPTFECLCEIETRTGKGIIELLQDIMALKFRGKDVSIILWAGMLGFDQSTCPSLNTVGDLVCKHGVSKVLPMATDLLKAALEGVPQDEKKEPTPTEEQPVTK